MPASTKPSPRRSALLGCVLLVALTAGCTSPLRSPSQVDRLLKHPEFRSAAQAAPHFTAEALKAVADLEARRP
ncbi:MAG: hypothetical protein HZC55_26545 [Verrucomicrobia bacterium]|nr:hypothetical protein [Verrucomicrobiota bacterium]